MTKKEKARERDFPFQYAAKFICTSNTPGTSQTTAAHFPGAYLTLVNIHNPHDHEIRMQKKLASPIQIFDYLTGSLKPNKQRFGEGNFTFSALFSKRIPCMRCAWWLKGVYQNAFNHLKDWFPSLPYAKFNERQTWFSSALTNLAHRIADRYYFTGIHN